MSAMPMMAGARLATFSAERMLSLWPTTGLERCLQEFSGKECFGLDMVSMGYTEVYT